MFGLRAIGGSSVPNGAAPCFQPLSSKSGFEPIVRRLLQGVAPRRRGLSPRSAPALWLRQRAGRQLAGGHFDELDFSRVEGSAVGAQDVVVPQLRLRRVLGGTPGEIGLRAARHQAPVPAADLVLLEKRQVRLEAAARRRAPSIRCRARAVRARARRAALGLHARQRPVVVEAEDVREFDDALLHRRVAADGGRDRLRRLGFARPVERGFHQGQRRGSARCRVPRRAPACPGRRRRPRPSRIAPASARPRGRPRRFTPGLCTHWLLWTPGSGSSCLPTRGSGLKQSSNRITSTEMPCLSAMSRN